MQVLQEEKSKPLLLLSSDGSNVSRFDAQDTTVLQMVDARTVSASIRLVCSIQSVPKLRSYLRPLYTLPMEVDPQVQMANQVRMDSHQCFMEHTDSH